MTNISVETFDAIWMERIVPMDVDNDCETLRLLKERELRLKALDAAISEGLADAKAGRTKPAEEVFDRLEAKHREMAKQRRKD